MTVSQPVTDYIQKSLLHDKGDIVQMGVDAPEKLSPIGSGQVISSKGVPGLIYYRPLFDLMTAVGDMWIRTGYVPGILAAGGLGTYLQGKGAGVIPAYEQTMPPLTTKGDLIVQNDVNPTRLPAGDSGGVLTSAGGPNIPGYAPLFDLLETQGDLWVLGEYGLTRIVAGALDTYFKGQGAGATPIYEKMSLGDTGIKINHIIRSTDGDEVITGLGFQPSVLIFFTTHSSSTVRCDSWGFDDGTTHKVIAIEADGVESRYVNGYSINVYVDVDNHMYGLVSALGSDGFTVTFSLTGACPVSVIYLALP